MNFEDILNDIGYKPEYDGQGESIIVTDISLDNTLRQKLNEMGVKIPAPLKEPDQNDNGYHGYRISKLIKRFLPKAEVTLLPNNQFFYDFCTYTRIDTISASISKINIDPVLIDRLAEQDFIIAAVGNDAENLEEELASHSLVLGVGAVCKKEDNLYEIEPYSSYGLWQVDTVGIDAFEDEGEILKGSSFSVVSNTILSSQFNQFFKSFFGFKAPPQMRYKEMINSCQDIDIDGRDIKTGYGLYNHRKEFKILDTYSYLFPLNKSVKYDLENSKLYISKLSDFNYTDKEVLEYVAFIVRGFVRQHKPFSIELLFDNFSEYEKDFIIFNREIAFPSNFIKQLECGYGLIF